MLMEVRKWSIATLLFFLIFFVIWDRTTTWNKKENVINEIPLFVNQEENLVQVIHLEVKKGKVSGIYYQYEVNREELNLSEHNSRVSGVVVEQGYAIDFEKNGQKRNFLVTIEDGVLLLMDKEAERLEQYEPFTEEELDHLLINLKGNIQAEIEGNEAELKKWRNNFFEQFKRIYRYYAVSKEGEELFSISIEDALNEGEWWGELEVIDQTTMEIKTTYPLNGITDGNMIEFYLEDGNKKIAYKGNFKENIEQFKVEDKEGDNYVFQAIEKEAYENLLK